MEDAWRANYWLRTGIRVLMRLSRFQARDKDELYAGVKAIDWRRFIKPNGTLVVSARTRESTLDHTRFIEQRVKDAVVDQFREATGQRPSVDRVEADVHIDVHLFKNRVSISVDTSGNSLHKRGWRRRQVTASLSEVLAAGMVQLSGWNSRTPLLDPFCGAGTILIEAGMMAAQIAPGSFRERFAFEGWPGHDAFGYAALKAQAREGVAVPGKLRLIGTDWEAGAIESARENAEAAGLGDALEFEVARAEEFQPRPGWNAAIVTNPPYGDRVGEEETLLPTYRGFGDSLRQNCSGYTLSLLSGSRNLGKALALKPDRYDRLSNGPIPCHLLHFSIY
jgi:23S rRNA G2445 N2-methylase RlmL